MEPGNWTEGMRGMATELWVGLLTYLPRLAMAAALLLAGWIVGLLLRWLSARLVTRLTRARAGRAVEQAVQESGVARVASEIVGRVVFWTVLLFSAALAAEVLELSMATGAVAMLMRYLPSVLAALLTLLAGVVLGRLTRDAVAGFAASAGISGPVPGQLARYAILLLAAVVALDQIGIDSTLLILAVAILFAALLGSAALAVGLGARAEVGNMIGVHYVARSYTIGQRIRIGDVEGRIVGFRQNAVELDTPDGRMTVPGGEFSRFGTRLIGEAS